MSFRRFAGARTCLFSRQLFRPVVLVCFCLTAVINLLAARPDLASLGPALAESRGQALKGNIAREYMLACMEERQLAEGMEALAALLKREGEGIRSPLLSPVRLNALLTSADALKMLDLCRRHAGLDRIGKESLRWLFRSNSRLSLVVENLSPHDDLAGFLGVVDQLSDHDPKQRDAFLPLILAMALVWDQPRPPLHHQMGASVPNYKPALEDRYDYFKELYSSSKAAIRFDRLSVSALTLVVDTPVPITELRWARDHVRGSRANWGRKFRDIEYDDDRLKRQAYSWDSGPYTLAAIEKEGGICVDQAYYATITARAHGIPAMIFVGQGRRGSHAWIGYMKSETDWQMDVGRYEYDKYATGHTVDPQTNRQMTDHDVEYRCTRSLKTSKASLASRYTRIADALARLGAPTAAEAFADKAVELGPLDTTAWGIVEKAVEIERDDRKLYRILSRKADIFQRFPDYFADIRRRQAEVLRRLGREAEAKRLLNTLENRLDDDRGDLAGAVALERIKSMLENGDNEGAREKLEDLIKDQIDEGEKILPLVQTYLRITKESGQEKAALRFLKIYLKRVEVDARGQAALDRLLLQAYLNAGDERGAARLRDRM